MLAWQLCLGLAFIVATWQLNQQKQEYCGLGYESRFEKIPEDDLKTALGKVLHLNSHIPPAFAGMAGRVRCSHVAALVLLGSVSTSLSFAPGWLPSRTLQGAPRIGPSGFSTPGSSNVEWEWGKIVTCVASLVLAFCPLAASARDGKISPPTCVAIIDAATNCPARPAVGAKKNAETQLKSAQERLAAAEKEAGKVIELGESPQGEPEMVEFWKSELARLDLNRTYMSELEAKMKENAEIRLVSQLSIETSDVAAEEKFWCEALGMQRYKAFPDGSVVVAFGPPSIGGEEGGYFGVKIVPTSQASAASAPDAKKIGPRLSYVQLTTPSLIRISRVISTGGAVIDGYGYYGVQSPAGVLVRAYVEDRRDPMELVALAVEPEKFQETSDSLKKLGLQARGPYKLVSPEMQAYMPPLPDGNMLFGSDDPNLNVQVLLLPELRQPKKSGNPLESLGRGPTLLINEDNSWGVGILDDLERPLVPLSLARNPRLTIYGSGELQVDADLTLTKAFLSSNNFKNGLPK